MSETDDLFDLDDQAWMGAERFWQRELTSLETEFDQEGAWEIRGPELGGNGLPLPREITDQTVCFACSATLNRAVKIQQFGRYEAGSLPIDAWIRIDGHDPLDLPPILHVVLELTPQTAEVARSLLRKWMEPGTSTLAMNRFIQRTPARFQDE